MAGAYHRVITPRALFHVAGISQNDIRVDPHARAGPRDGDAGGDELMEPQWAKDKKARALALRKERKSYEQIAAELAITPWQAFAWTNPTKLPKQIAAWMQKHYPEGSEERERAIAQVHAGR
jgi:hypothetical protein